MLGQRECRKVTPGAPMEMAEPKVRPRPGQRAPVSSLLLSHVSSRRLTFDLWGRTWENIFGDAGYPGAALICTAEGFPNSRKEKHMGRTVC